MNGPFFSFWFFVCLFIWLFCFVLFFGTLFVHSSGVFTFCGRVRQIRYMFHIHRHGLVNYFLEMMHLLQFLIIAGFEDFEGSIQETDQFTAL